MARPGTRWRISWTEASLKTIHQFAAVKRLSFSSQIEDSEDLFLSLRINKLPSGLQQKVKPKVLSHIKYWMKEWLDVPQVKISKGVETAKWPSSTKIWAASNWDRDRQDTMTPHVISLKSAFGIPLMVNIRGITS